MSRGLRRQGLFDENLDLIDKDRSVDIISVDVGLTTDRGESSGASSTTYRLRELTASVGAVHTQDPNLSRITDPEVAAGALQITVRIAPLVCLTRCSRRAALLPRAPASARSCAESARFHLTFRLTDIIDAARAAKRAHRGNSFPHERNRLSFVIVAESGTRPRSPLFRAAMRDEVSRGCAVRSKVDYNQRESGSRVLFRSGNGRQRRTNPHIRAEVCERAQARYPSGT
jgi:hypothetical protein